MPWGFAAAAVVGAAGSIYAAHEQAQGQEAAANTQRGMFDTINQQEQPFIQAGQGASTQLSDMLKPGGFLTQQFNPTQQQLENYPGYQFAKEQGGQAIRNKDTPGMGALSGAALKDLMQFNSGLAETYYGDFFNQFQTQQNNIFDRLSGLATLGQNAAGNLGTNGAALGTGTAQAQAGAAASRAAGYQGAANSFANTLPLYMLYQQNQAPAQPSGGAGNGTGGAV